MEESFFRRILGKMLSPHVLRFGAVGLSGVLVNLGSLAFFSEVIKVPDLPLFQGLDINSSAIAVELSIIWNFFWNNAWTFRDRNAMARVGLGVRLLRYNLVSLVGLVIQLVTLGSLSTLFMRILGLDKPGIWKYPSQLAGIALAMAWNFVSNFFWTWAQSDPPPSAER